MFTLRHVTTDSKGQPSLRDEACATVRDVMKAIDRVYRTKVESKRSKADIFKPAPRLYVLYVPNK